MSKQHHFFYQMFYNDFDMDKQEILIKNEKISIVYMNKDMAFDVWQNSLDEDNRRFVPDEVFETLKNAEEVINFIIESYQSKEGPFIYAVIRNEDNANIGYVQLVKIDLGYEIGYHIAKRYTGQGYATETVKLFLEYLRNNTKLKEIYGVALFANKASVRVLEKCGFEKFFEGIDFYQGKKRKIVKTVKKI